MPASPPGPLPLVPFNDSLTSPPTGQAGRAFPLAPAHPDGDVVVHLPGMNAIPTGDTFFNGTVPILGVSAGGSIDGMIAANDRVLALCDGSTKIIPGHGPLGDRVALQAFRDMLVQVRDRVRPLVRAHKTLEQVLAAHPTAGLDSTWGTGGRTGDRFGSMGYADLSRRGRGRE